MKLELCGELMETPIDKEYIENAINSLVEDDFFKSFMVLSKDDYCFMQIIRLPSPANTFVLEFKEGADGILYTCISEHLNTKQVI